MKDLVQNKTEEMFCPACGGQLIQPFQNENIFGTFRVCKVCGGIVSDKRTIESSRYDNVDNTCPHCMSVNAPIATPDKPRCSECNLDPTKENYTSAEIAFLWKEGSAIRRVLERGTNLVSKDKPYGFFIRKYCGPKCTFSKSCCQTIRDLTTCLKKGREPYLNLKGDDVSKKRNKRQRRAAAQRAEALAEAERNSMVAKVLVAPKGWLAKNVYNNETTNNTIADSEQVIVEESRSRA